MAEKKLRRSLSGPQRKAILRELDSPIRPNKPLFFNRISDIYDYFHQDLYNYFCATQMARATTAVDESSKIAAQHLFAFRTRLEKAIIESLNFKATTDTKSFLNLATKNLFSYSKKQGVSFRLPLTTCLPSKECANLCYAHDGMDAAGPAVVKGALNFVISQLWYDSQHNEIVCKFLEPAIEKAVNLARKDALNANFVRRPRIRFAHVGELPAVAQFGDYLAARVRDISADEVDCVVYTRHKGAADLSKQDFIMNFTIDETSTNRITWAPPGSRIVASSFGGKLQSDAEINFLEHHRHDHMKPLSNNGAICPATLPNAVSRSCDGNSCTLCFNKP